MEKGGGNAAAPTGCFKCGRPGHWSRDCPSSGPSNPNPSYRPNVATKSIQPSSEPPAVNPNASGQGSTNPSVRKPPRTRPKLTPELLLSEKGLGYVLKHFPKAFKYHGRGREVNDLGNLIAMYAQWHSQLIPYYSFDQFIKKVEMVGCTKRVRACLRDLRQRVANGGDPTKLHEPPTEQVDPDCQPEMMDVFDKEMEVQMSDPDTEALPLGNQGAGDMEEMFNEIYQKATEETQEVCNEPKDDRVSDSNAAIVLDSLQDQCKTNGTITTRPILISDEQRARMEANRLKALERAAARRALQAEASSSAVAASW